MLINPSLSKGSLTIAICAYNEQEFIREAIQTTLDALGSTPNLKTQILVIDDGSVDATSEIVLNQIRIHPEITLIQNEKNLGLGASIQKAIQCAHMEKFIFLPGDNDLPLSTLKLLFRNAFLADVVMTYFPNDECRGRKRYLLSSLFKVIYTSSFDLYMLYVNGPAVYPTKLLQELKLKSTRFSIVVEINVKLLRQGLSFLELPSSRQVGMLGSTSASFISFIEVIKVYLHLIYEVHIKSKSKYIKRPSRVDFEFEVLPK